MADQPHRKPTHHMFHLTPVVTANAVHASNLVINYLKSVEADLPTMLIVAGLLACAYAKAKGVSAIESLRAMEPFVARFEHAKLSNDDGAPDGAPDGTTTVKG